MLLDKIYWAVGEKITGISVNLDKDERLKTILGKPPKLSQKSLSGYAIFGFDKNGKPYYRLWASVLEDNLADEFISWLHEKIERCNY